MIDDQQLVNTLLEQGFLDQASLKESLDKTEETGRSLYETLIFDERVSESDLVRLVSELLDVPSAEVNPPAIPEPVRTLVPGSMARRNRVLPLALDNGELVLAMVDPVDLLAMDEVSTHTGISIRPVLVGPATLDDALSEVYPDHESADLGDEIMASFEDFDVQGMMDEVMAGDEWSDLFVDEDEEARPSVEDSAVLSREMRDRPSTDVLAEEDLPDSDELDELDDEELPEIEIIEELGKPVSRSKPPDPYTDLDRWEVDDAITGNLSPNAGDSEILSAASAHELFSTTGPEPHARLDRPQTQPSEVELEEHVETSVGSELSAPDSEVLENESRTSVGVGVRELEDVAGPEGASDTDTLEATGRTALGVGPMSGDEDGDEEAHQDVGEPRADDGASSSTEGTDYGALGRAILKTKPTSEASEATDAPNSDAVGDEADELDAHETNVAEPSPADPKRPTQPEAATAQLERRAKVRAAAGSKEDNPNASELDELEEPPGAETDIIQPIVEDEEGMLAESGQSDQGTAAEMAVEPIAVEQELERETQEDALLPEEIKKLEASDSRERTQSPTPRLPPGIDVEGLALALANLLIAKDILTLDEVFQLAQSLSTETGSEEDHHDDVQDELAPDDA